MSSPERPEELPSSWAVEVTGSDEQKHEGNKSPSETVIPEASEAADVAQNISEKKQETSEKSNENAISGTQVDGLPPGWIKEVIVRRAKGHPRKDPYYLDPSSDYAFLSKLDALRYLENGNIEKCAIKPKKKSEIMMKKANMPIKSKSTEKKSTKKSKKSTFSSPSRAAKRVKPNETIETKSEVQPEKEKNEGCDDDIDTEEVKGKDPDVEKSTNDEKTEIPLIPEPVTAVKGEIPISVEERKSEVANL